MWYREATKDNNDNNIDVDQYLKDINVSKKGVCMYAIETLTKSFLDRGIIDFWIVEGYVKFENRSPYFQHTWIVYNNKIIDPSLQQFMGWNIKQVEYKEKKRYQPHDYLSLCIKHPIDPKEYLLNNEG